MQIDDRYIDRQIDRWKQEKNVKFVESRSTCFLLFCMFGKTSVFHFKQVMISIFSSRTIPPPSCFSYVTDIYEEPFYLSIYYSHYFFYSYVVPNMASRSPSSCLPCPCDMSPLLPCFLGQQDVPGSCGTFPVLHLELVISSKILVSSRGDIYFI